MSRDDSPAKTKKRKRHSEDGVRQKKKKRKVDEVEEEDEEMVEAVAEVPASPEAPAEKRSAFEVYKKNTMYPALRASGPVEHEALGGDKELWLFQVPKEFDVDVLDGKTVTLAGDEGLLATVEVKEGGKKTHYSMHLAESRQYEKFVNVFPSSKEDKFLFGEPFTQQINLVESVALPKVSKKATMPPTPTKEPMTGLQGKYRPFGGGNGVPKETFAALSKQHNVCTTKELSNVTGGSPGKKKKTKKASTPGKAKKKGEKAKKKKRKSKDV